MAAADDMLQVLEWIGFAILAQRNLLIQDVPTLGDLGELTESDITSLSIVYSKRTVAEGRIHFGLHRTKRFKASIHWVQDFERVSEEPSIDDLNQALFQVQIRQAQERATIRQEVAKSDTISKDSSPGRLQTEKDWEKWSKKFKNYLSTIPGVFGIPLSYVIRENDDAAPEGHDNFMMKCVACASLEGPKFEADARQVHQIIMACVEGENSEEWVKKTKKKQDGRQDFKSLHAHYEGAGRASRRIAHAEQIKENTFYKSERAMPFSLFLNRLQTMFNIYEEEEEPIPPNAKVRLLYEKIQHPKLLGAVEAMKVSDARTANPMTFTEAANHLSCEVSKFPEFKAAGGRAGIGAVKAGGKSGSDAIRDKSGNIISGYLRNWRHLSQEDREAVLAERKRLGKGTKENPKGTKSKQISSLEKTMQKQQSKLDIQTREIAALKRNSNTEEEDGPTDDAGNQFGGRQAKKNKKTE